jgi:hypothetical protein
MNQTSGTSKTVHYVAVNDEPTHPEYGKKMGYNTKVPRSRCNGMRLEEFRAYVGTATALRYKIVEI